MPLLGLQAQAKQRPRRTWPNCLRADALFSTVVITGKTAVVLDFLNKAAATGPVVVVVVVVAVAVVVVVVVVVADAVAGYKEQMVSAVVVWQHSLLSAVAAVATQLDSLDCDSLVASVDTVTQLAAAVHSHTQHW